MAFSSGLSVPTMSTHHPAPSRIERGCQWKVNRERERGRVKPKLPKATWSSLPAWKSKGSICWGDNASLFRSTASRFSCYHDHHLPHWWQEVGRQGGEGRRTSVLLERVEGHWSHKFNAGTQTHTWAAKLSLSGRIHSKQFIQCEGRPSVWFI